MIVLAIDPGHGMSNRSPGKYDTGATSFGVEEADICLQFAQAVQWVADQEYRNRIRVVLTRISRADTAPVGARAKRAEKSGANAFVSIHCNSNLNPLSFGSEIYYRDDQDERFADILAPRIAFAIGTRNRGVRLESKSQHSRLAVLNFHGPAVLVELGFLTNRGERARLQERGARVDVARAILRTVEEFHR